MIGSKQETFKLTVSGDWFKKHEILSLGGGAKVKVITTPTTRYNKWYYKLLNFITFGKYFNIVTYYTVQKID